MTTGGELKHGTTDATTTGVQAPSVFGTRGHTAFGFWAKSKSAGASPAATVKLQGSLDTGGPWDDLITLTFTAAESQQGVVVDKPYMHLRVNVTALTDLEIDEWRVYGTGFAGSF